MLVPAPSKASWDDLRKVPDVAWTGVRVPGVREVDWVRWIDPPLLWDELVHGMEAVVLPVFRLDVISRVATLLGDVPASAAALAGVMQGVPVLASSSEVDLLKRSSGRLPGPFLSLFHQHLRTVEGMGISVLEPAALVGRLSGRLAVASASSSRDVITAGDLKPGQKVLSLAPGAIITPLAREKAAQMGIEVRYT